MFRYEKPLFEKKRLLRIEMLEQLRDYPRDYLEILYSGYSDGIVCGCTLSWNEEELMITPGILKHKERLYFMKNPVYLECKPEDRVRYLKVQFLAMVQENSKEIGNTRMYLNDKHPDSACELELCRFRLQEGARLRGEYENFADCTTEFDTIHLVDVPWSSPETATLHPKILSRYATEILKKESRDGLDTSFAFAVLANAGELPERVIRIYIEERLGNQVEAGNRGLYLGLKKILEIGRDNLRQQKQGGARRQVMLL